MELKKIHISDIGKIVTGKTPRTSVAENYDGYIPFLTPSDDLSHKSAPKTTKTLTEQGLNEVRNCLLPSRSICVSCIGSDLGKVVMTKEPTVTNQQFNSIIPNKNFNADFVYYFMTLVGRELNYLSKTSTAVPIINKSSFSNYEIEVPDLETQNRIASILSSIDSKIELNRRINDNLEAMAKQLYDYWFVQFDFPNEEDKPYKSSGGAMVWNEKLKREIPEGWNVANVFDELSVQYGFPFSTELFTEEPTSIPVVRIRDILENSVSAYSEEEVDEKYKLQKQDLLVGMDGNFHMNYWNDNVSYLNQRSVRLRAKSKSTVSIMQAKYDIAPYIKAKELRAKGSTVGHLSDKDLKELFVLVCPNIDFRNKFDSILAEIIENRCEMIELTKQRDELLPFLMNGQASVNSHLWNSGIL